MHQGWPKFTQNLWYATADKGVAALVYAPSKVNLKIGDGTMVEFVEETNYPFDESVKFTLKSDKQVSFPFHLRIPAWCKTATVKINGTVWDEYSGNQVIKIKREWKSGDRVELILPMELKSSRWYENSVAIERGPLTFALKIGENWKRVENNDKYGKFYYEVEPTTPWNYGLIESAIGNLSGNFVVVKRNVPANSYPWNPENCPLEIRAKGVKIPFWTIYNGSAGPLPYSEQYQLKTEAPEPITLIPYGCTTLRICEFPVVTIKP
jgi:hypothetical protein